MNVLSLIKRSLGVLGAAICLSGCLIYSHDEKVLEPEAERLTVRFENDEALETFQNAVSKRYRHGDGEAGSSRFWLPFLVSVSETEVLSENAYYNRQVEKADVEKDGVISQAEAEIYAKQ